MNAASIGGITICMPSLDDYHAKNPKVNAWRSGEPARRSVRQMSALVERLAGRLGIDSDELVKKIPPDTLRRTKYPVIETVDENGFRHFDHDLGIQDDGRQALVRQIAV